MSIMYIMYRVVVDIKVVLGLQERMVHKVIRDHKDQ